MLLRHAKNNTLYIRLALLSYIVTRCDAFSVKLRIPCQVIQPKTLISPIMTHFYFLIKEKLVAERRNEGNVKKIIRNPKYADCLQNILNIL